MPAPKKRMGKWTKRAIVAGTVAALGTGAITGGRALKKYYAKERAQAKAATTALVELKAVRNPNAWGKICGIYDWNPNTQPGRARINFIESVSKKTKVPSNRVMATIESNALDAGTVRIWQNRLRGLQSELKTAQRIAGTQKGDEARRARSRTKTLPKKIAQAQRVIDVVNTLLENPKLAKQIRTEALGNAGSLDRVRKIK